MTECIVCGDTATTRFEDEPLCEDCISDEEFSGEFDDEYLDD